MERWTRGSDERTVSRPLPASNRRRGCDLGPPILNRGSVNARCGRIAFIVPGMAEIIRRHTQTHRPSSNSHLARTELRAQIEQAAQRGEPTPRPRAPAPFWMLRQAGIRRSPVAERVRRSVNLILVYRVPRGTDRPRTMPCGTARPTGRRRRCVSATPPGRGAFRPPSAVSSPRRVPVIGLIVLIGRAAELALRRRLGRVVGGRLEVLVRQGQLRDGAP